MSNTEDFIIEKGVLKKYKGPGGDVVIPEGVTEIGWEAFSGCSSLAHITIPADVTEIEEDSFSGCSGLTSITIPAGVTEIGWSAFSGCCNLEKIHIEEGNEEYTDIDGVVCNYDASKIMFCPEGRKGTFVIPSGVTEIEEGAFSDCRNLTSITIPESITEIGEYVFAGCSSLTSITIPTGVTEIGMRAFMGCSSLTSITIPSSVTEIEEGTFSGCSNLEKIHIEEGNEEYTDIDGVVCNYDASKIMFCPEGRKGTFVIPSGVTEIEFDAFFDCRGLASITIPTGITEIEEDAFSGCINLEKIHIEEGNEEYTDIDGVVCYRDMSGIFLCPEGRKGAFVVPAQVEEIDFDIFSPCRKLEKIHIEEGNEEYTDIDGVVCNRDMTAVLYCPEGRKEAFEIPEGVKEIARKAFSGCSSLTRITIPSSVTEIGDNAFSNCSRLSQIDVPEQFKLKPDMFGEKLPPALKEHIQELLPNMTDALICEAVSDPGLWKMLPSESQADIFLKNQGKTLLPRYLEGIQDPLPLANEILNHLESKPSPKICNAAATFMILFSKKIDETILRELYGQLKSIKTAKKALEQISADAPLMAKLGDMDTTLQNLPPVERRITEYLVEENLSSSALEKRFQDFYSKITLPAVSYKDGSRASAIVLQWLLTVHEKFDYDEIVPSFKKAEICQKANEVLKELDSTSFQAVLRELAEKNLGLTGKTKKMYLAYPICRYADEALMTDLTKEAPHWRSSVSGNDAPPLLTFRQACLYSNTKAAMLFADKFHDLDAYAKIRKTDADTIRDQYLSDVGINEQGEKAYDLGNQTVVAQLQPDLSFLIRKSDGKTAKSLPKKDADLEKYETANADFNEMKKNAKRIVKNRCAILFEDFISGRSRSAAGWKKAYLQNPLLRSVAKLLVWKQGDSTFTLDEFGAIQADGTVYEINNSPISAAHPMEMKPEQAEAWQKYFTTHGLKQPFAQIWEPVIDPAEIHDARYQGSMIPYYRFRSMEKHGIYVKDEDFHNEIDISFKDCDAVVERIDWQRHEIDNDDRFEVTSFSFKKYTRQVNHIAAYLDRITVYDRILKDDVTVETFLPGFTLAQITDFVKLATENNCPNVTALLLNYKNKHFADFDPMEEFTLGDL